MEKLEELITLAEKGEIKYTPRQLKKFTEDKLQIIYNEYQAKQLDQTNELLTIMIIDKFDSVLKNTSLIKPDSQLGKKLQDRELFKKDVKTMVSYFTPILPFVGLIEGVVITASEVYDNYNSTKVDVEFRTKKDESPPSKTEEREEPSETESSQPQHDEGQDPTSD